MTLFDAAELPSPDGAVLSADRVYRYLLWRQLMAGADEPSTMLFIMLNPSTADETTNDATLRVCLRLADREGATRLEVVNLYAYRARDPKALLTVDDPVGPENVTHVDDAIRRADLIVAAWSGKWAAVERAGHPRLGIEDMAASHGKQLYCLGQRCTDKARSPRHPLYTPNSIPLNPFDP